jgi:hypothetical protein
MTDLSGYIGTIEDMVPGTHNIDEDRLDRIKTRAVNQAIYRHSKSKPREVVEDMVGTGAFYYALSGLTYWSETFSQVLKVEYPVDDTDEDPEVLDPSTEWAVYQRPGGKYLYFLTDEPATTESMRITYTAMHTVSHGTDSTVNDEDDEAFMSLCACMFCRLLASAYSLDQDSTIDADSVQHSNKAQNYRDMAKDFCREYYNYIGISEDGRPQAAVATKDLDLPYPTGHGRLTHPGSNR